MYLLENQWVFVCLAWWSTREHSGSISLWLYRLFDLYRALNANPAVVLDPLEELEFENEDIT